MCADQAVNVERVGIGRVFDACGCPQELHAVCTFGFQCGKFGAAEVLRPVLVGGFGKGDGDFAFEMVGQCCVKCAVHTGDEEAGDGLDMDNALSGYQTFGDAARVGCVSFECLGT